KMSGLLSGSHWSVRLPNDDSWWLPLFITSHKGEGEMAFNNLGSYYLAAGAVGRYWVSFGGADHGAQFIGGQVQNPGGSLQMSNQTKCKNADGSITYWVTIQNIGNVGTNFALQGGGYDGGFNNVGSFFLGPNASGRYSISYGGSDHGGQAIAGQVENP